jgi:aryl-alcohol dehydrogenase-like predicted oxidoreductase
MSGLPDVHPQIRAAYDEAVTFFDTAEAYSPSGFDGA